MQSRQEVCWMYPHHALDPVCLFNGLVPRYSVYDQGYGELQAPEISKSTACALIMPKRCIFHALELSLRQDFANNLGFQKQRECSLRTWTILLVTEKLWASRWWWLTGIQFLAKNQKSKAIKPYWSMLPIILLWRKTIKKIARKKNHYRVGDALNDRC